MFWVRAVLQEKLGSVPTSGNTYIDDCRSPRLEEVPLAICLYCLLVDCLFRPMSISAHLSSIEVTFEDVIQAAIWFIVVEALPTSAPHYGKRPVAATSLSSTTNLDDIG